MKTDFRATRARVGCAMVMVAAAWGVVPEAEAAVIKSYLASGVFNRTDLECNPGLPICVNQPFTAELDYLDSSPNTDDRFDASSITFFRFIEPVAAFSFWYRSWAPLPAFPLGPGVPISALIEEQGPSITFTAEFRRSLTDAPTWIFRPDGSFSVSSGHGEGDAGLAGAVNWQLVQDRPAPEPGSLWLSGLALTALAGLRARWRA